MNMYINIHIYVCIYVYVYVYMYVCIYIYIHVHGILYIYIYTLYILVIRWHLAIFKHIQYSINKSPLWMDKIPHLIEFPCCCWLNAMNIWWISRFSSPGKTDLPKVYDLDGSAEIFVLNQLPGILGASVSGFVDMKKVRVFMVLEGKQQRLWSVYNSLYSRNVCNPQKQRLTMSSLSMFDQFS